MKKFICLWFLLFAARVTHCQTDTIVANSWQDAMDMTFGLLPKTHYPTHHLLNKASILPKMVYANGLLNDSSFNMLEFYFIQNAVRMSYDTPDSIKGYLYLDSIKNIYIEENNVLPWGIVDRNVNIIKDSAFIDGSVSVNSYRLIESTEDLKKIYGMVKLFCVSPLNLDIYTLNPQFILQPQFIFSNNDISISKMEMDLDDGSGFRAVFMNTPFQASYANGGFKKFITRIIYANGDTLYSRSELNVIDNNAFRASGYDAYDETYTKCVTGPVGGGLGTNYIYPTEFTPNVENRCAQVGIWYACGNVNKKIRKPYVIFGGYNPKNGKSLEANNNADWINDNIGGVRSIDGWRGPMYETYDGYFTDASKNAGGGNAFGSNGNRFLDKLRQEGYDIIIVRFVDGIGYLQTTAFLATIVLKDINEKIIQESDNVMNPGAALDPEAPGYPNSTKIKKAKHELIVSGYSAGALAGRMALLLMEYEHEKYKCTVPVGPHGTNYKVLTPIHRTKLWVAIDHESQGSNVPIGQQMFMDFQKSLQYLPANLADILNSFASKTALDLLTTRGVATQNTLYHLNNTNSAGSGSNSWNAGHHQDFDVYFANLAAITPTNYPLNLKGYPKNCYRIAVSQGSAIGAQQLLNSSTNLLFNQSPTHVCFAASALPYGIGAQFFSITPFREATARVLSSWNSDAFDCKTGLNFKTLFYNWYVSIPHWKYHSTNVIRDQYVQLYQAYDIAPASTLPSHIILAKAMALSFQNYSVATHSQCNWKDWNPSQHGFSPTVSGLDLHAPGNNTLPRLPNLSLAVPGNISGGLNLMQQNKYNLGFNNSPNNDFGYPYLTYPSNHYDYTPYDAIWANTTDNANYDNNTIHVEDPNPLIGTFLEEEIAPKTLYLSNRTIAGDTYTCGATNYMDKYYADFEARNSVLVGNQTIYEHDAANPYKRQRTSPGDFVIGNGAVVTIRANNSDGVSSVVLGPGFSVKDGSIFRAYIYTDPNTCSPFSYNQRKGAPSTQPTVAKESRPIITKRLSSQQPGVEVKNISISLFPNPTTGNISIVTNGEDYSYTISEITGKVLQTGILKGDVNTLNLTTFDNGVYLITISNKNYTQTDRMILQ